MLSHSQSPELNSGEHPWETFDACVRLGSYHQNTKRENIFGDNGLNPSNGVPETRRIHTGALKL